ncbi:MAG: pyridoxal phosphate-dependent aminotransferase [Fibrobacterota bacterium]
MTISRKIQSFLNRGSMIRKLFEEGARLAADGSGRPVYDFSIGNPDLDPPEAFQTALEEAAADTSPGVHKYMPNAGYPATRTAVAQALEKDYTIPFTEDSIIMTVGAGGGLNTLLKALIDPGDEVIAIAPYFVEYNFYTDNHGGRLITVDSDETFTLPVERIAAACNDRTAAVIITNPNNPTGVVYSQDELNALGDALRNCSEGRDKPIYLIDDAPYRKIIYDQERCPSAFEAYENTCMVTSHSKDLGLPGERIGYIAISPHCADPALLFTACAFTNRTLGFVNASALMQRVVAQVQDVTIDLSWYRRKRDLIYSTLQDIGYELPAPGGAFYMFIKVPGDGDDRAFIDRLREKRVLAVPGSAFGTPGYFRISYCVDDSKIEGALPLLREAFEEVEPS